MRYKIANPFVDNDGYNCFACAPHNPIGLRLTFERRDNELHARWQPSSLYQGYSGIVHGGIQATLLDEVGSWAIYVFCGVAAVTHTIAVEYRSPLPLTAPFITAVASVARKDARIVEIAAALVAEEKAHTEATIRYRVLPKRMAERMYGFPDAERFHAHAASEAE